jgi:NADH dehydrogenase [ubiquinone] 1 alpha subcomplex assembly factor 7
MAYRACRGGAVSEPDLTARLVRHIRAHGPMTVASYMAMALHDPEAGYYARRQVLGAAGDFVTAPEISQIFGELIGAWCADQWQAMGSPDPVVVAELGPGRGTLMADFLRAAAALPGFRGAIRLVLVETSPLLRGEQQRRLAAAAPLWVAGFDDIPDGPLLIVANEFLDALPIRQLVRGEREWRERLVALDAADRLCFGEGPESPAATLLVPPSRRDAAPGAMAEICPPAAALAAALAERLVRQPGAALFIDYGYAEPPPAPTLAAIDRHRPADILERPGEADLSAHVDFAAFGEAARAAGAAVYGPVAQGDLFAALGAAERLVALSRHATPAQRGDLAVGLRRLIDPAQMGTLFKAMAITSPGLPVPAGFARG